MGELAMQNGLRRHLGRALHLLGELHLRRERPDLGTQHLEEAFMCFMGYIVQVSNVYCATQFLYGKLFFLMDNFIRPIKL